MSKHKADRDPLKITKREKKELILEVMTDLGLISQEDLKSELNITKSEKKELILEVMTDLGLISQEDYI